MDEKEKVMAKRKLFGEMTEGVEAIAEHRDGKMTLRSFKVEVARLPKVVRETRRRMRANSKSPK